MVKLTPELIEDSYQYMNPIKEYELCLRGYKISIIENLGATLNQFDTIDFTDNDIQRLDGFPVLTKLKSLLLNNNRIKHVCDNLESYLPNLETLILTNNNIEELYEIDRLSTIKSLKNLSLIRNPLASLKHYRLYTIYRIPQLRILDFKKIKQKERQEAQKVFKGKKLKQANKVKTFVPGEAFAENQQQNAKQPERRQATKEELDAIRIAINDAKTLEEMEQLSQMLKSGIIPDKYIFNKTTNNQQSNDDNDDNMEEDDDDEEQQQQQ